MFTLRKAFKFEAAHQLPNHDGKCARLHGHSWTMIVECTGLQLQTDGPKVGMLLDYAQITKVVKPLVDEHLDHWFLNESTGLANPTSEELARWIYDHLKPQLKLLFAVEVEETCTNSCRYQPTRYQPTGVDLRPETPVEVEAPPNMPMPPVPDEKPDVVPVVLTEEQPEQMLLERVGQDILDEAARNPGGHLT